VPRFSGGEGRQRGRDRAPLALTVLLVRNDGCAGGGVCLDAEEEKATVLYVPYLLVTCFVDEQVGRCATLPQLRRRGMATVS